MESTAKSESTTQIDSVRWLLGETAVRYERHRAGEPEGFNIFTVLRTESDEVNLHSRFLVALLCQRHPRTASLRNLEDFLRDVAGVSDFPMDGAEVERERHYIDILIRSPSSRQAVVIENKIRAPDQHRQLARYAERMEREGYLVARLLYLTLDGHAPDGGTVEGRDPTCLSYKEIVPWLEGCQERACDNPALRESIAQYIRLVRKLTGTDLKGVYMKDLSDLILENNNLVLVHDLNEAMFEARVVLLEKFWNEIDEALRKRIPNLRKNAEWAYTSRENIWTFLSKKSYFHNGLYYNCDGIDDRVSLFVGAEDIIYFGVYTDEKKRGKKLKERMRDLGGSDEQDDEWPWFKYVMPFPDQCLHLKKSTRDNLALLANGKARRKCAKEIANGLGEVADWLKRHQK